MKLRFKVSIPLSLWMRAAFVSSCVCSSSFPKCCRLLGLVHTAFYLCLPSPHVAQPRVGRNGYSNTWLRGDPCHRNQSLNSKERGVWVAQPVERLTSAQVVISRFMSLSPTSSSAQSPLQILCPSLSAPPLLTLSLSLSLSKINKH